MTKTRNADIGVLTIIPAETIAVSEILKRHTDYQSYQMKDTIRDCYAATVPGLNSREHRIVCTQSLIKGELSIMPAYQDLMKECEPTLIVLLGIGGSIHKSMRLCDVAIGESSFNYDKGKVRKSRISHQLEPITYPPWITAWLNKYHVEHGVIPELKSSNNSRFDSFRILRGPIGTGSKVVKFRNAAITKWLREVNEDVLVLETEAGGFGRQFVEEGLHRGHKALGGLIIRGVSDHADEDKDDKWQVPAASNAFKFLVDLLSMTPDLKELIP